MNRRLSKIRKNLRKEKGSALVIVLIFFVIGCLALPPLMSLLQTTLKAGTIYRTNTNELYTADSGIEDAIWQIKYDHLEAQFIDPAYDIYDFNTEWGYSLGDPLNNLTANITIENVWIPKNISPLSASEGRAIIEAEKLIVNGTAISTGSYTIKLFFTPGAGEEESLLVDSLGIWLPYGFSYVDNSSNLEVVGQPYYSNPSIQSYAGGEAVIWDYNNFAFASFPGVDHHATPEIAEITFNFTANVTGTIPTAIAWIETNGVADVPISWDIDTRVYKVTSRAGDTVIDAYTTKSELRKMGSAINGDYKAVGNSLMKDTPGHHDNIREIPIASSNATISDIPADGVILGAFLYWSGWLSNHYFIDDNFNNGNAWTAGNYWTFDNTNKRFKGRATGTTASYRYLTLKNAINMSASAYQTGNLTVSWKQWEDGTLEADDGLQFEYYYSGSWHGLNTAFVDDIGSSPITKTFEIPIAARKSDFKFRFYLNDFGDSNDNYCYIDDFKIKWIAPDYDSSIVFMINETQVYLDGDGEPQTGTVDLTADNSALIATDADAHFYACNCDVTELVKAYSDEGDYENPTGNGNYRVGGVDATTGELLSYAGWSIIVIYSSVDTAGNQLYLFDTFAVNTGGGMNLDFDFDGQPGGTIRGFYVPDMIEGETIAARLTCFVGEGDACYDNDYLKFNGTKLSEGTGDTNNVWNSESIGMTEPGVDIDTFEVTWASGLLGPGDTTAQLDLYSQTDNYCLIYMILAMRSQTSSGGTTQYVIHK